MGQHWVFSAMALAAGACLAAYALYAWRHRRASAGASLAVVLAAAGWWSLAYALELAATNLPTKLLWGDAKWLGIALLPPAWYAFVMQYNGRGRWVNRPVMAALAVPPVAVVVLLANPATHDLVRYYPPSAAADPSRAIAQVGPLFWPFLVYADLVVWGCTALFVWTLLRLSRLYWRQSLLLIVTLLLPILANLLHNLKVGPFGRVELTPFLLVLTGAVLVWGVFRFRLLDLAPIARSQIFQLMQDAVVVLDPYGRVVDANLAAERLLGQQVGQVVGQPLAQLVPAWTTAISHGHGGSTSSDSSGDGAIIAGRVYDLTVSALPDRQGQPTGDLLIARDVSERRQAERDLRDSLVREQAATERLSAALQREQAAAEQLSDALEREQTATQHLRELDQMKDAFLQAVSHDLRTPLTSVLGIAATLDRGHQLLPASEVRDLLGRLAGNARKLGRLLTNLLDLERLTQGTLDPDRQDVDLGELVSRIVKDTGPELLGERGDRAHVDRGRCPQGRAYRGEPAGQRGPAHPRRHAGVGAGPGGCRRCAHGGRGCRTRCAGRGPPGDLPAVPAGADHHRPRTRVRHRPGAGGPICGHARRSRLGAGATWGWRIVSRVPARRSRPGRGHPA